MKREDKLISRLVGKILNENIGDRAEKIESQLKHKEMKEGGSRIKGLINQMKGEVNELGGMDDGHPISGGENFGNKDRKYFDRLIQRMKDGDYGDVDDVDYVDEKPLPKRRKYDDFDYELKENHDSEELKHHFGDKEYPDFDFSPMDGVKPNLEDLEGGITPGRGVIKQFDKKRKEAEAFRRWLKRGGMDFGDEQNEETLYEIEMEPQGEVCECGGDMSEGVCNECGNSLGMMEESEDVEMNETNVEGCKTVKEVVKSQNGEVTELDQQLMERYNCGSLKESLIRRGLLKESLKRGKKKQSRGKDYIAGQAEPKDKIDAKDFKVLRDKKSKSEKEVDEGNEFTGELSKAKKEGKSSFSVDGKKYPVKESIKLTETELVSLIEKMVNEELKIVGNKPRGLSAYESAHKGSGNENKKNLVSVKKKMGDYLKDGSKGKYEENPKHFPKGNGGLSKKYNMSEDGKEFIEDYMQPAMENLDYDEVHPNDKWLKDNIEGSSRTGNNPKWANAEETELGERINKKRKANKFAKAKRQAYNKAPQPVVSDKTGDDKGTGIHIKVESTEKQTKVLNEEFNKIKNLMNYDRKTQ
jgi:hypothetical protein